MFVGIVRELDTLAASLDTCQPDSIVRGAKSIGAGTLASALHRAEAEDARIRGRMVMLQEEIDWAVYRAFGLTQLGAEIEVLEAKGATVCSDQRPAFWTNSNPPGDLPAPLRSTYVRRRAESERSDELRLVENPVCKRPWLGRQGVFGHSSRDYGARASEALRGFLLDRLEGGGYWPEAEVQSAARLADRAREDREFMQVAELYRGRPDFDVAKLVLELVQDESVPFLPILRYKPSGLRKRKAWEETWELQRKEDAGLAHGPIPVPPKYTSADFLSQTFWRLRGKLDVPKERFLSFPHAERPSDPSLPLLWAGFDHASQAQALAAYYFRLKDESAPPSRQLSILASLHHLLPWLLQYHPTPAQGFDTPLPTSISHLLSSESPLLSLAPKDLPSWSPPSSPSRRRPSSDP